MSACGARVFCIQHQGIGGGSIYDSEPHSCTRAPAQGNLWKRKGWAEMDKMRSKLEDLKELRDLVRSLGRGGGWGPLRRAPIQFLDMKV